MPQVVGRVSAGVAAAQPAVGTGLDALTLVAVLVDFAAVSAQAAVVGAPLEQRADSVADLLAFLAPVHAGAFPADVGVGIADLTAYAAVQRVGVDRDAGPIAAQQGLLLTGLDQLALPFAAFSRALSDTDALASTFTLLPNLGLLTALRLLPVFGLLPLDDFARTGCFVAALFARRHLIAPLRWDLVAALRAGVGSPRSIGASGRTGRD
jgi:hypothetical protein